jgi:DNA-directed RNA polymerase alpha subunit
MGRKPPNDAPGKWKAWIAALEKVVVVTPQRPEWPDWNNDLSVRVKNILHDAGINSFEQLCALKGTELMELRNFGCVCACEVREKLAQVGLALND